MVTDKPEQPGLGRGARADSLPGWARRATAAGYRVLPGLVAAFTVAAAATFLANHYQAPVMFFALPLSSSSPASTGWRHSACRVSAFL